MYKALFYSLQDSGYVFINQNEDKKKVNPDTQILKYHSAEPVQYQLALSQSFQVEVKSTNCHFKTTTSKNNNHNTFKTWF